MKKLTTREIEQRIDQFMQRTSVLQGIIAEIKDTQAKTALKKHIAEYKLTLGELRKELAMRNRH